MLLRVITLFIIGCVGLVSVKAQNVVSVAKFGAQANSGMVQTAQIQSAIDAVAEMGGGIVEISGGKFITGTLRLQSNVHLVIQSGSILQGSPKISDYPGGLGEFYDSDKNYFGSPLIYGGNVKNVSISGGGVIDGNGFDHFFPVDKMKSRPGLIRIVFSDNVQIKDVTLKNSAAWVLHFLNTNNVLVNSVHIESHSNQNNDGIGIDGGQNIRILNSYLDTESDSIVLKTLRDEPIENVMIANCVIKGKEAAFKIGSESIRDVRNVLVSNLVIEGTYGIAMFTSDGGDIENVRISDVVMNNSRGALMIRAGERMLTYWSSPDTRPTTGGKIRDIFIQNFTATNVLGNHDYIAGQRRQLVENVQLANVTIRYAEGTGDTTLVKRRINDYPKDRPYHMTYSPQPSYGIYMRHVKYISMKDVVLESARREVRPALVLDYAQDVEMRNMRIESPLNNYSAILMRRNTSILMNKVEYVNDRKSELYKVIDTAVSELTIQ